MDALKEGRCLLDRVPLHRACLGISGMDGLAMCKKCSPAVIRSFRIAGTESVPRVAPVISPGFHQRWSCLIPAGVSAGIILLFAAQAGAAAAGWDSTLPVLRQDLQLAGGHGPCPGWGGQGGWVGGGLARPAEHRSCSRPSSARADPRLGAAEASWMPYPSHPRVPELEKRFGNGVPAVEGSSQPVSNPKTSGQGWGKEKKRVALAGRACCSQGKTRPSPSNWAHPPPLPLAIWGCGL